MYKEFYRDKNGTHWVIDNTTTRNELVKGKIESLHFYPFPTLKFHLWENNLKKTKTFNIELVWFIWEIRITRHWGEAYKELECLNKIEE